MAVDQNFFAFKLVWPKDNSAKYEETNKKTAQMIDYFKYFQNLARTSTPRGTQPHIFYIDARWSSLAVMHALKERQMYGVLSCGENMAPKTLWPWIKDGLDKYNWWSIGNTTLDANLVCIRTKKTVYLKILTNYASLSPSMITKTKRKPPRKKYKVEACAVQKDYNKFKCLVDQFNKAVLEYLRLGMPVNDDVTFTQFYFSAFIVQSWTYYKARTGEELSQKEFRESLVRELAAELLPSPEQPALKANPSCWLISKKPHKSRCEYFDCGRWTTLFCVGCNMWGCFKCLQKKHHPN